MMRMRSGLALGGAESPTSVVWRERAPDDRLRENAKLCPRTPVGHVPGLSIKPGDDAEQALTFESELVPWRQHGNFVAVSHYRPQPTFE